MILGELKEEVQGLLGFFLYKDMEAQNDFSGWKKDSFVLEKDSLILKKFGMNGSLVKIMKNWPNYCLTKTANKCCCPGRSGCM